jgi:hypothetical protein
MIIEDSINPRRIREKAPYRKSMSLTEEDLTRASELERLFTNRYSSEAPFNFSKTISKALEVAIGEMLQSVNRDSGGQIQQALTGLPADPGVMQARQQQRQELGNRSGIPIQSGQQRAGKPKKFQKSKRGF